MKAPVGYILVREILGALQISRIHLRAKCGHINRPDRPKESVMLRLTLGNIARNPALKNIGMCKVCSDPHTTVPPDDPEPAPPAATRQTVPTRKRIVKPQPRLQQ